MTARPRPRGGARAVIQGVARAAMVQAQEAALLLSVAATVPLRLARGAEPASVSPHVKANPTLATHPVLLVHGFGGPSRVGTWSPKP